jgi:hypothetical protein
LKENKKKYVSEKNIPEYLENCLKLVDEHHIYKIERFDSIFSIDEDPIDNENLIWEGKFN